LGSPGEAFVPIILRHRHHLLRRRPGRALDLPVTANQAHEASCVQTDDERFVGISKYTSDADIGGPMDPMNRGLEKSVSP
jgi:hypothetical protein